MIFYS